MGRVCPICGTSSVGKRVYLEAAVDYSKLDRTAFSSRKSPEHMHFRLVFCAPCDLLYADPAPNAVLTEASYETASFNTSEESGFAANSYADILDSFISRLPSREAALDVGTGDGTFLEKLLERGFKNVVGIEPSDAPIRAANPNTRRLIRKGFFRPGCFRHSSLDLFTCFQTFEHLYDPLETCREAFRLLKPGGAILIVSHNHRSIQHRVLGRKSPLLDIEHLQLFSRTSMQRLLRKSGFSDIRVRGLTNRYPLHYWIRLLPMGRWGSLAFRCAESLGLANRVVAIRAGNIVSAGFKP